MNESVRPIEFGPSWTLPALVVGVLLVVFLAVKVWRDSKDSRGEER